MFQEADDQIDRPMTRSGKDEMNFAEFPIALLTDRVPKGQKSIKFEDTFFDDKRKKVIVRRRIIEGSEEYGLPTATDDAVILALIQLSKQDNFKKREVEFSRLELIRMLGWPNEGKSYERIKLSLLRITNVTYNYDNAWWDPRQKAWTTRAFHIIDSVEINDSRASGGQPGLFASRIVWGDAVFESFQSGFLRNLDFQLCMRLEHPTALRMYRFLGKRFHVRPDWSFDLKEFAYEHIGLGRNYEGGTQIARKLQPAIAELEQAGFLEPLAYDARFAKKGREWAIRFVQKAPAPLPAPTSETAAAEGVPVPLIGEMVARGVTKLKAEDLAKRFAAEAIRGKLDVFDWLSELKDKRVAKNPAGYLVKSIEEDYTAPRGFVSKSEKADQERLRQINALQASETRRRRQELADREKMERQAVEAYWASLDLEQQGALDAASLAMADPETLKLETGPMKRMGQLIRRNDYIRRILLEQEATPFEEGQEAS